MTILAVELISKPGVNYGSWNDLIWDYLSLSVLLHACWTIRIMLRNSFLYITMLNVR